MHFKEEELLRTLLDRLLGRTRRQRPAPKTFRFTRSERPCKETGLTSFFPAPQFIELERLLDAHLARGPAISDEDIESKIQDLLDKS